MTHSMKIGYAALAVAIVALGVALTRPTVTNGGRETRSDDRAFDQANAAPLNGDKIKAHSQAIMDGAAVWVVLASPISSMNVDFVPGMKCITRQDWLHQDSAGQTLVDTPYDQAAGTLCPKGAMVEIGRSAPKGQPA